MFFFFKSHRTNTLTLFRNYWPKFHLTTSWNWTVCTDHYWTLWSKWVVYAFLPIAPSISALGSWSPELTYDGHNRWPEVQTLAQPLTCSLISAKSFNLFASKILPLWNGDNYRTNLTELSYRINEITSVKLFIHCLQHGKSSVNLSYYCYNLFFKGQLRLYALCEAFWVSFIQN